MVKLNIRLTSGGTINQGQVTKSGGKSLPMYTKHVGSIFLDKDDFNKLQVFPMTPVKVRSEFNEVIVYAQISADGPHPGVGFIPRGPWCNLLVDPYTYSSGCPMFKDTPVTVEPADSHEKPLNMPELMKKYYIEKAA
ncbi:MAG: molybdopterin dinucleotide-binding protein [Candidatus Lokiarchaeota archaeon]|nr:molybdopterin dinucleotide-binding protein [Candidatus Lokiarchaeota archaeon]